MGEAEKVISESVKDVADPPSVVFIRRKRIDKPIENIICLWNVVGANQVFNCDKQKGIAFGTPGRGRTSEA